MKSLKSILRVATVFVVSGAMAPAIAQAAQPQQADKFKNGMSVCLESRGFAVK